jgi:hypothetical protein
MQPCLLSAIDDGSGAAGAADCVLQVLALDVILANGTRRVFTNETDPFLMRVSSTVTLPIQKLMCFTDWHSSRP